MTVHNPARCVVGLCPECDGVIVVTNNYDVWDLATCVCGWAGGTTELGDRLRFERGKVSQSTSSWLLFPPDRSPFIPRTEQPEHLVEGWHGEDGYVNDSQAVEHHDEGVR